MKFLYSDTQDYVDPEYDFINDRNGVGRERYWSDAYAHELMSPAPYDGLLMSMSAIRSANGVAKSKVRYSIPEEQRLLRNGARKFLRFDRPEHKDLMIMGDCGAFAYVHHPEPAYSPDEVVEFYAEAAFTHGISPDHIIFECDLGNPAVPSAPDARTRYETTLANAEAFLRLARSEGVPFETVGAVQGWSPASMANAAQTLIAMGFRYLAIGGLVPLKVDAIKLVVGTIRNAIGPEPAMHLLGFSKADQIDEFTGFGITSFDSTSPLIRAFKDERSNYYAEGESGGLEYYTAIRIPQVLENTRLMQGIKRGMFDAEDLHRREQQALRSLRELDQGKGSIAGTLELVMDYYKFLLLADDISVAEQEKTMARVNSRMRKTLEDKPWRHCDCDICRAIGVEVIIFRSSNRNKRRGFHNLGVYHRHLHRTLERAA